MDELKSTDNGEQDLELEIGDRLAAMHGTPVVVWPKDRAYMRKLYRERAAEKAAQTGRVDGMKPAPGRKDGTR